MTSHDQRVSRQPSSAQGVTSAEDEPFFVEIEDGSSPENESSDRPDWFRGTPAQSGTQTKSSSPPTRQNGSRERGKHAKTKARRAPIVRPQEQDPEEELTWQERLKRWIQGEGGAGYGISVVVHIILLLAMSLWILSRPAEEDLITEVEQTEVVDVASIQDIDVDVDLKPDIPEQVKNPEFEPAPLSMPDIGIGSLASSLAKTTGGGFDLAIPKQAVTKGSFTVWTVPEDPMPGQQYVIMIQIKLKNNVKRFPRRDVSGNIVGTDGYKDYFGGPTEPGYYPIENNSVRFQALTVPGAAKLVKDVINVESKILDEKQRIELVF